MDKGKGLSNVTILTLKKLYILQKFATCAIENWVNWVNDDHIILIFFFKTLFGSLNHFGQNVLHLVPKQKREKKKEENYISEMRYLNGLRLKQDSLVIERKETGISLYDLALVVLK